MSRETPYEGPRRVGDFGRRYDASGRRPPNNDPWKPEDLSHPGERNQDHEPESDDDGQEQ